ncbi:quinone oxidoreductase [Leeia sp. TBRC 13508]|uniref:Quinone oxidoreductase n=1 Tax=Leeia speluncae TaxID=2884804 RepID=A0ABS8D6A9_9NEIS|nr:quinone oxidoreductase [Leeia speluncae]MCB6183725.1 quinone oxidoreductase [Leeia speluncae]
MKAEQIQISAHGGPEVLQLVSIDLPAPAAGEVQIRQYAAGLNFIDIYHRTGLYAVPLPSGIGQEGAGEVIAVGDGVDNFKVGDRIAYAGGPIGGYASVRNHPAKHIVKLPDGISFEQGAAMMLQGLTSQYLLRQTYRVSAGDTILIHAAAGGVGLIATQWAKALGATVIGTVSSEAKAELAKAHGCDHVLISGEVNLPQAVKTLTGGVGVPVVYDGIGKDTFNDSLDCLRPRGLMVSFGNASGAVPAFEPSILAAKGSLYLTRPTLAPHIASREALDQAAAELFEVVLSGKVKIEVNQRYALKDAAQAQIDLAARKTTGSTVLIP